MASKPVGIRELFRRFASLSANAVGSPWAFALASLAIIIWAVLGPIYQFSNTWQLVINTGTTIITFLMIFLVQNTQNRDARAIHIKLDELIRSIKGARDLMVDLENCTEEELAKYEAQFKAMHKRFEKKDVATKPEVREPARSSK